MSRPARAFIPARAARTLLAAGAALLLAACNPDKNLTQANVEEVATGMARKQVESILGLPTTVETEPMDVNKKVTYIYKQGGDTVTIVFWDDKVESMTGSLSN